MLPGPIGAPKASRPVNSLEFNITGFIKCRDSPPNNLFHISKFYSTLVLLLLLFHKLIPLGRFWACLVS